jgi:riboflavin synthase
MFTGIVAGLGTVQDVEARGEAARITVSGADLTTANPGDSIAVDGVCLTAAEISGDGFAADLLPETRRRTSLGDVVRGRRVNLEMAATPATVLGGHLVQGHVDGVGTVVSPAPDLVVRCPAELLRYVVEKGSITVDGCSLTVVEPLDDGFRCAIIPHTTEVTVLGRKGPGARVNLEVDVIAKYTERLLSEGGRVA